MIYYFEIEGKIIPYVRMTQRSKYVSSRAQAYMAQQEAFGLLFRAEMERQGWEMLPKAPLGIEVIMSPARHNCDASNILKAIEDAMNGIVYPDDRWLDHISLDRLAQRREQAFIRVYLLGAEA